ncbi:hypothetical protein BDB01DRAFT_792409 [Pilobolus umbonatus]|nr:hypothetical protein BDB01DRAFT_792409 [Pilobolus umbonatus]
MSILSDKESVFYIDEDELVTEYDLDFMDKCVFCHNKPAESSTELSKETDSAEEEEEELKAPPVENIENFQKYMEEVYYELLYTDHYTTEIAIFYFDCWITELLKAGYTQDDIASNMLDLTLSGRQIDLKYKNDLVFTQSFINDKQQEYIDAWTYEIAGDGQEMTRQCRNMWTHVLREREARFQTVLFFYITRLSNNQFISKHKETPSDLAKECYIKTSTIQNTSGIGKFLHSLDQEKEDKAECERDPCDTSDVAFGTLLEERFGDLPELVEEVRDVLGLNETFSPRPLPAVLSQERENDVAEVGRKRTLAEALDDEERERKQKTSKVEISSQKSDISVSGTNSNYIMSLLKRSVVVTNAGPANPSRLTGKTKTKKIIHESRPIAKSSSQEGMREFTQQNNVIIRKPVVPMDVTPRTSFTRALGYDLFDIYGVSPTRDNKANLKNSPFQSRDETAFKDADEKETFKLGRNLLSTFESLKNIKEEEKITRLNSRSLDEIFTHASQLSMEDGEEAEGEEI